MSKHLDDTIDMARLKYLTCCENRLKKFIREEIKKTNSKFQMVYLPNLTPKSKAKYIFIGSEPSFDWATDEKDKEGFQIHLETSFGYRKQIGTRH